MHEQKHEAVRSIYPNGMHAVIAEGIRENLGERAVVRTATLDQPEHGLTDHRQRRSVGPSGAAAAVCHLDLHRIAHRLVRETSWEARGRLMAKHKALLVGAGNMGKAWGRNLKAHEDVRIVAWVDIRPDAAAVAADALECSDIYTGEDLGQAIAETGPDFVVDVTVPEAHHDVTLQALAAGLPVLGEKPMAASMGQAQAMVAASEKANTLYMVSQSRRYDPHLHAYRELIEEHIGPPGILKSDFFIGAHFGGFREDMEHVLVLDMAIHTFDAARYLSGADPVSVYCEEYNPSWSWYKGDACANALFEMTGGTRYQYLGSWCGEGRPTSWEGEWRALGPNGTATWDGTNAPVAEVVAERGGFHSRCETHTAEVKEMPRGIAGSLRDFLHALETGATPMSECHDNIKSLAMVFGAIESAAKGQRVTVAA